MKFFIIILMLVNVAACSYKQQAIGILPPPNEYQITEFMLDNGMKVIVKEDHRAPLSIVQLWYRVGSSDEHNGITGISHALEHMMFKGTPKYPGEQLTEIIKREGGQYNAFTGPDYTAYYEVFEKSRMSLSFELESDRMMNLILDEQDFAKEIEVVKEERRLRTEDKPGSKVWEQLYATAFHNSPYGRPIIGWMDDLENLTLADLEKWYRKWYHPGNAFMVVAGDVEPEEVRRLAVKYMAPLPAGILPKRKPRREVPQLGERRIVVSAPAEKPFLVMGYKVPNYFNAEQLWETYALNLLSTVMSGTNSARFSKNIIRGQRIAQSASSSYDLYSPHDDLFAITATPLDGVSIMELEQAIEAEITKLKEALVTEKELDRIKIRHRAGQVYSRDSIRGQAYRLGQLEAVGAGWRQMYEIYKMLAEVTPEQIQAVARKYLVTSQRTVAIFEPEAIKKVDEKTL